MSVLRLENIDAGYGQRTVLHDLSLEVGVGEIVALIGPNGAGKSTILQVAAGFLEPNRGHVWFDGEEITDLAPHERIDRGLSYCIQGGRVFPSLSVAENLEMGTGELSGEEGEAGREAVLELFPNLKPLLDRRAGVLSGGERQALALGMVLVNRPEVLLLDEPSASLSPALSREVLLKVQVLHEKWRLTTLLVEQEVRAALNTAQRAMAIVNGRVSRMTDKPASWVDEGHLEDIFVTGI